MSGLYYFFTIFAIIILIVKIFIKKDYFSLNTYILLGVYFPLIMSHFNWSFLHVDNKPNIFYIYFIIFDIISIYFAMLPQKNFEFSNFTIVKLKKRVPIEIYNVIYLIFISIENIYASGYIFPSLHGIDVHTVRMPYIYFFTTAIYFFTFMNLMEFFSTKKKKYLLYIGLLIGFNIITKSSRRDAFMCIIQLLSLVLLYYFSNKKEGITYKEEIKKKKNRKYIILVSIVFVILVMFFGMNVGINRMNSNGKYNLKYSDGIGYTGPEFGNGILSYYYGYFPLSFDNLAYNMKNANIKPNYVGLCSFRTLFFGILQFDNLFGLDGGAASRANIIRSKAAAVATGFWDFYYDYKEFFFIPLIISFTLYYFLKNKLSVNKRNILSLAIYFYWIPLWMFLSFDNRIYDYQVLAHIILMALIIPKRYKLLSN